MNLETTTPPPALPVSMEAAFVQLRLDPVADVTANPEYDAVATMLEAATTWCEASSRRAFVQQTVRLTLGPPRRSDGVRAWLAARPWGDIELLRPPLIEVESVEYYDDDNALQTVDPALYFVTAGLVPRLAFTEAFTHPGVYLREDAIRVTYIVGYPPLVTETPGEGEEDPPVVTTDYAGNVPKQIKQAILIALQLQYDELAPDKRTSLEKARDALLKPLQVYTA